MGPGGAYSWPGPGSRGGTGLVQLQKPGRQLRLEPAHVTLDGCRRHWKQRPSFPSLPEAHQVGFPAQVATQNALISLPSGNVPAQKHPPLSPNANLHRGFLQNTAQRRVDTTPALPSHLLPSTAQPSRRKPRHSPGLVQLLRPGIHHCTRGGGGGQQTRLLTGLALPTGPGLQLTLLQLHGAPEEAMASDPTRPPQSLLSSVLSILQGRPRPVLTATPLPREAEPELPRRSDEEQGLDQASPGGDGLGNGKHSGHMN